MNYTSEVIKAAYDELNRRRETAIAAHDSRIEEIRISYPEIYGIYAEIAGTKDRLAEAILKKGSDTRAEIEKIREKNLKDQEKLKKLLNRFSLPDDYLEVPYCCKLCSDSGVCGGNRCECVTAILDKLTIDKLNEGCKIKLSSFADFNISYYPDSYSYRGNIVGAKSLMEENLRFCMDYVKCFSHNSPSVFMYGATGLGKTFLSGCIVRELLKQGYSVAFDSIQNYLRDIESEHFKNNVEGDTLGALLNADLVVLDDLGSEFTSNFNSASVYNIINSRLNMGKPTIVSSNLTLDELSKKYDDRIISRLTGMFHTLRFIGEDIRQIKRREGANI